MNYGAVSEQGKVRSRNEDSYLVLNKNEFDIIAVADGMGGHKAGDIASSLAVDIIKEYDFTNKPLAEGINEVINLANQSILKEGKENSRQNGMGTTLTLGVIKDRILTIGHIGDSRAYLFQDEQLRQITTDHSFVEELVKKNMISKEEAKDHPKKNLLMRALGVRENVEIDLMELELEADDLILLCSDGVTNMISDSQLMDILALDIDLQAKAERVATAANQAGGYDNITAIIYQSN